MTNKKNLSDAEMAKLARNAYLREWRRQNPEKVKQYQINHWKKKFKEMQETKEQQKSDIAK